MNTAQAKLFAWTSAGVLGAGLSLYMVNFARSQDETRQTVTLQQMKKVLEGIKDTADTKQEGTVSYDLVKQTWIGMNWTGQKKEAVVEAPIEVKPPEPTKLEVSKLLAVQAIQWDPSQPANSKCVLKYTSEAQVNLPPAKGGVVAKKIGDKLEAPHESIRVFQIDGRGVEFAFADEARQHEIVAPKEFDLGNKLVKVGEGQQPVVPTGPDLPRAPNYGQHPERTLRVGPNTYKVGVEDAQYINEHFDDILANQMRVEPHRDPRTGKRDGLELKEVKPDSVAAQHGAKSGDVIKSINGHPVKSQQEAIQFVKANAKLYDKWEILIENMGQEHTLTIFPPPPKD